MLIRQKPPLCFHSQLDKSLRHPVLPRLEDQRPLLESPPQTRTQEIDLRRKLLRAVHRVAEVDRMRQEKLQASLQDQRLLRVLVLVGRKLPLLHL